MENRIAKTIAFLNQKFDESDAYIERETDKNYRLEHTMRVANIGRDIARAEKLAFFLTFVERMERQLQTSQKLV